jgi:hypothetical protein
VRVVPVVLFAFRRPDLLRRTLEGLRSDGIPLFYAFSDGPRGPADVEGVEAVRDVLKNVDWTETHLVTRPENLGLGRSVRAGVSEVLRQFDSAIVFEDDLVSIPGTYRFLVEALEYYTANPRVMSITAWTHPRVVPARAKARPYFDGRAECWAWATWSRSWDGMDQTAMEMIGECEARGIDVYRYGADLVEMAEREERSNIWAVRWLFHHIRRGGLCLRPPRSLVEHIGVDERSANVMEDGGPWKNERLGPPPEPGDWPAPEEEPACAVLWQRSCGGRPRWPLLQEVRRMVERILTWIRGEAR